MNINRMVTIKDGKAVGRFREFLDAWWDQMELTAMLAPVALSTEGIYSTQVLKNKADLQHVNPFVPYMPGNSVGMIGEYLNTYPEGRLAIILRPCELRTMTEIQKRNRLPISLDDRSKDRVVIISVDCPGTFPANEFEVRIADLGLEKVVQEAFTYGLDSSPTPRQMRTSCQVCNWPAPNGADLTIGTLGVAAKGYFLLIARDELMDHSLHLAQITDGNATEHQVSVREMAVGTLADQHKHTMSVMQHDFDQRFGDFSDLLACLARCTLCADCLDACPLYNGELSSLLGVISDERRNRPLLSELVGLSRWLASCSGCGMCQEACEHGVSLDLLLSSLSQKIRHELSYSSGDPSQPLPWEHPHKATHEVTLM